jgi:hypothetical protein
MSRSLSNRLHGHAAKDGFKIAGTTANAVIMERKAKEKDEDEDDK